jgi:hypothetical protein
VQINWTPLHTSFLRSLCDFVLSLNEEVLQGEMLGKSKLAFPATGANVQDGTGKAGT